MFVLLCSSSLDMQFCSLHHRVLLFIIIIILTLNTAPGSSLDVFPTRVKLHHPVKLPCKHQCSGSLKWALRENRDVVQAQCDQTSCWSEKGFNISHDQYLRGDLSLTITAANYSLRNVYACECRDIDRAYVRLVIETVFSQVQMEFDEDLKLHVSVPEPVEVIYKSSGSSDEVICRVNKTSLWCKDEYRDRTSLTYPEITLRHMEPRDSGKYTIRDTENEEDIEIYAVSVEEKPFPTWGIVLIVLILLCCTAAVGTYLLWRQCKRIQLNRLKGVIEEKIREVEEMMNSGGESLRKQEVMMNRDWVSLRQPEKKHNDKPAEGQIEEKIREVEENLNHLQDQYKNTEYSDEVSEFCREKRKQLMERRMHLVVQLVQQAEEGEEVISKVEMKIDELEDQYRNTGYREKVSEFCSRMKSQLNWNKLQTDEELKTERDEVNSRLFDLHQSVQKARAGTVKISAVEMMMDRLKSLYRNKNYYYQVSMLCDVKRMELNPKGPERERYEKISKKITPMFLMDETVSFSEINDLEKVRVNIEDLGDVTWFCAILRAELIWRKIQQQDIPIMKKNIECILKLEQVMDGLEKIRDEVGRGRRSAAEINKMQEELKNFIERYKEKRREEEHE